MTSPSPATTLSGPHRPALSAAPALAELLRSCAWGRLLGDAEFARVRTTALERSFGAGEAVARAGDEATHWVGVRSGLLKMSVTSADGRLSTLTGAAAGAWYGEGSLFEGQNWGYDVEALRPSRVVLIPRETFRWLRDTSLPFNHYLQSLLSARLGLFIGMLADDRLLGADARVARCLSRLHDQTRSGSGDPVIRLHQGEIALLAGVSRQRANAALHRLQQESLISVRPGRVTIRQAEGLRQFTGPRG